MLDSIGSFASEPDARRLVDASTGRVDRRIFSNQEIYELELERIFARTWNFMCHESQIPKPGDFFLSFIGEDSVIATRDKKGNLHVLLNTCRHRGNAVCRAEQGHASSFLCTYHGWTYGLDGKLIGVPGFRDFYHQDLDRSQWGLIAAPKVGSYKGFVFASMDPDAPELADFLGEAGRLGLDLMAARGDVAMVDGVQKNVIGCNWKLAVDNQFDFYHPPISHASAFMANFFRGADARRDMEQRVVLGDYGHAIGGPKVRREAIAEAAASKEVVNGLLDVGWRASASAQEQLGEIGVQTNGHALIFPNLWIALGGSQLCMRMPRGPLATEIWWFTLVEKNVSEEQRRAHVAGAIRTVGPAGMLEQEDGENWAQSTRGCAGTISKRFPLNFTMGLGRGKVQSCAGSGTRYIDAQINEHAQMWMYQSWADWMAAPNWESLQRNRTPLPDDVY